MKQEDKDLLLRYMSMALPYDLQVKTDKDNEPYFLLSVQPYNGIALILIGVNMDGEDIISKVKIDIVKPFLRPMSSMTEEEINEFILISDTALWLGNKRSTCILSIEQLNWLNAHHFDFLGLISKDLAIEVTEENNPYK